MGPSRHGTVAVADSLRFVPGTGARSQDTRGDQVGRGTSHVSARPLWSGYRLLPRRDALFSRVVACCRREGEGILRGMHRPALARAALVVFAAGALGACASVPPTQSQTISPTFNKVSDPSSA